MDFFCFIGFGNTVKVVKDRKSTKEIQVRPEIILVCYKRGLGGREGWGGGGWNKRRNQLLN